MFNTALFKIDNADRQEFRVYLNEVIAGRKDPAKRPATDKYTPKNEETFRDICATYPFIRGYINFSDKKNTKGTSENINTSDKAEVKQYIQQMRNDPHYANYQEARAK